MNTKPTAIKRLFMSLTVSVGLLPGPLLHAEEQPNAETQVLKGKIVVEAGTQYLLLKAPIELDGKTIEKLELVKDKDDKNTEGIKSLSSNEDSDPFVFLCGTIKTNQQWAIPRFTLKALTVNTLASTAESTPPVQNFNFTINQTTLNQSSHTMLKPTTGGNAAPAQSNPTGMEAKLAGKWTNSTDSGSLSIGGQSLTKQTQLIVDLEKDKRAMLKFGMSGSFDFVNSLTCFGTWSVSSYQGTPTLIIHVKDYSTEGPNVPKPPAEIIFYIKHVGESTLVLRENKAEYQLSK